MNYFPFVQLSQDNLHRPFCELLSIADKNVRALESERSLNHSNRPWTIFGARGRNDGVIYAPTDVLKPANGIVVGGGCLSVVTKMNPVD